MVTGTSQYKFSFVVRLLWPLIYKYLQTGIVTTLFTESKVTIRSTTIKTDELCGFTMSVQPRLSTVNKCVWLLSKWFQFSA